MLFPGRNVKWSEAIPSRIFKGFLVSSILDCRFFEAFSSSLTEANVVGDYWVVVTAEETHCVIEKQMRREDLVFLYRIN